MQLRSKIKSIRRNPLYWRYGTNLGPTVRYFLESNRPATNVENSIVRSLDVDGIAICRVEDMFTFEMLTEMRGAAQELLNEKRSDISKLKSEVDNKAAIGYKTFNLEMLGGEPQFSADSVFARIGLNDSLLSVANRYLRLKAQLRYYNVWYTAASTGASRESQLWHFDREDKFILKVFIYLDDVDEGSGPLTYAPSTHRRGKFKSLQPEFVMEGNVRRTTDEQMTKVFPRENWKVCTGRKGTIVFADTRGYHKGGEARTSDRVLYTCMYTSPASRSKDLMKFPADFDASKLSREQQQALRIPAHKLK